MLRFILKENDGKERVIIIEKDVVRIGKSEANDLILSQPGVSRRHAIVRRTGGKVVIEDLVSTNGTFVNGKRISAPQELNIGDLVFISGYTLQLDMFSSVEEPTQSIEREEAEKPAHRAPGEEEKPTLEATTADSGIGGEDMEEPSREPLDEGVKTFGIPRQEMEEWAKPGEEEDGLKPQEEPILKDTFEKPLQEEAETASLKEGAPERELIEEEEIPFIPLREEDMLDAQVPEPQQMQWEDTLDTLESPLKREEVREEEEKPDLVEEQAATVSLPEESVKQEALEEMVSTEFEALSPAVSPPKEDAPLEEDMGRVASRIYRHLLDQPELYWRFLEPGQDVSNRQIAFLHAIRSLMDDMGLEIPPHIPREELSQRMMEEAVLPGIVEQLMADPDNRSIMINGKERVFIERGGKMERTEFRFSCDDAVMAVASWMLMRVGKHIDSSNPIVDARLENGAEIHVIIPPMAFSGPCLTIRKPGGLLFTMADLVEKESLSKDMAQLLKISVENGMNILITGTQGSGKTTLLMALASLIPEEERVITIEDWPELSLPQENVVSLLTCPPEVSGQGGVTVMDLVRSSLKMRPDRVVLGGCSSEEVIEIFQAGRGGIRGLLAAVHVNSPRQALVQLNLSAGLGTNLSVMLPWIASMVDLIVQCVQMSDGRRKVTRICEVADSGDEPFTLRDIFRFESSGFDKETSFLGSFVPQNVVPRFIQDLEMRGVPVEREMFQKL
ncbi:MAG: Flp pilus assembly complex ATPase component TadA [Deltaproteobacteria bacterium]|nr:Flp pilus assembly complex ATPase component TadA [Deltaproteobacteria bacterium]